MTDYIGLFQRSRRHAVLTNASYVC